MGSTSFIHLHHCNYLSGVLFLIRVFQHGQLIAAGFKVATPAGSSGCVQPPLNLVGSVRELGAQSLFSHSDHLIRHRFARPPVHLYNRFARIEPAGIRGDRHHLKAIQMNVRKIVAQNHRGAGLANLSTSGWVEINPPHFTPAHGWHRRSTLHSIPTPPAHALHRDP